MDTYKIGNKIRCTISSYIAGPIGVEQMQYDKQPYTVLSDIEAVINFENQEANAKQFRNLVSFSIDHAESVDLNNVPFTKKIMNLIYDKKNELLYKTFNNYNSDESGKIILFTPEDTIFDIFIYDDEGQLEKVYNVWSKNEIQVNKPNSNYLIFYSYKSNKGYNLERNKNLYLSLDLECIGNENDQTTTFFLHLDKCALSINKTLYFNNDLNNIDLHFKVLDNNNYIILK